MFRARGAARPPRRDSCPAVILLAGLASCVTPGTIVPVTTAAARPEVETAPAPRSRILGTVRSRASGELLQGDTDFVVFVRAAPVLLAPPACCCTLQQVPQGLGPALMVVPVGQRVRLVNDDLICHRWFSSAEQHAFDTGMVAPGTDRMLRFEQPGAVHVYCALHEGRQATILVVPTPHYARVGRHGEFEIDGLLPGPHELETWAEGLQPHRLGVLVPDGGGTVIEFPIDAARRPGRP